jgi:N-acetylneuraminic acid mutarotase
MDLRICSGAVSRLRAISTTHRRAGVQHGAQIRPSHATGFRDVGQPARMGSASTVDAGDTATVAGQPKPGSNVMKLRSLLCVSMLLSCLSSCANPASDNGEPRDPTIVDFSPSQAMVGDTVVINGRLFGNQSAGMLVNFGAGATTPFEVTDTRISAVVPASATSGNLYLTFGDQSNAFASASFVLLKTPIIYFFRDSARVGELIDMDVWYIAETMDLNAVRIRFAGSSEWLVPVEIRRNPDYTHIAKVTVRVPAGAGTGKIGVVVGRWAPFESNRDFKAIPAMPPIRPGVWTQRSNLGGTRELASRQGAASFTIGNKAYVVGGTSGGPFGGSDSNRVYEYDPQYDTWTRKADLPGGNLVYSVAFAIGEKGYVGTGQDGDGRPLKEFWEYDPRLDAWTRKADFPGSARAFAVGFAIDSTGYIGTGFGAGNYFRDFYEYHPSTNTWSPGIAIPSVRAEAYSFVVDGKAYAGGGRNTTRIHDFYMYDPATRSWTEKTSIPTYNYTAGNSSFTLRGKGYVGLGYDLLRREPLYSTQQVFEYDPVLNTWRPLPDFGGIYRTYAVGFAIGDVGYFGTGIAIYLTHSYQDFWAYMP